VRIIELKFNDENELLETTKTHTFTSNDFKLISLIYVVDVIRKSIVKLIGLMSLTTYNLCGFW